MRRLLRYALPVAALGAAALYAVHNRMRPTAYYLDASPPPWTGDEVVLGGGASLVCDASGSCTVQGTGGGRPADEVRP